MMQVPAMRKLNVYGTLNQIMKHVNEFCYLVLYTSRSRVRRLLTDLWLFLPKTLNFRPSPPPPLKKFTTPEGQILDPPLL